MHGIEAPCLDFGKCLLSQKSFKYTQKSNLISLAFEQDCGKLTNCYQISTDLQSVREGRVLE
jgi:hypothetical protein